MNNPPRTKPYTPTAEAHPVHSPSHWRMPGTDTTPPRAHTKQARLPTGPIRLPCLFEQNPVAPSCSRTFGCHTTFCAGPVCKLGRFLIESEITSLHCRPLHYSTPAIMLRVPRLPTAVAFMPTPASFLPRPNACGLRRPTHTAAHHMCQRIHPARLCPDTHPHATYSTCCLQKKYPKHAHSFSKASQHMFTA